MRPVSTTMWGQPPGGYSLGPLPLVRAVVDRVHDQRREDDQRDPRDQQRQRLAREDDRRDRETVVGRHRGKVRADAHVRARTLHAAGGAAMSRQESRSRRDRRRRRFRRPRSGRRRNATSGRPFSGPPKAAETNLLPRNGPPDPVPDFFAVSDELATIGTGRRPAPSGAIAIVRASGRSAVIAAAQMHESGSRQGSP